MSAEDERHSKAFNAELIADPLPTWDWDWVTQGWPKRHPSVMQGPPKGRIKEVSLFAMKVEKCRAGVKRSGDLVIARDRVIW